MEQDAYYFRVGVFVAVALAVSVMVISMFASKHDQAGHTPFAIYFNGSVDGLIQGAPVKLRGIKIGYVESFSFIGEGDDTIRVLIEVLDGTPIHVGTVASLQMLGLTGGSMIALENTGTDKSAISAKDKDGYLQIVSRPSSLERVFTSMPQLLDDMNKLMVQGQKMLSDDNINAVHDSLTSASGAVNALAGLIGGQKGASMQETFAALNQMIAEGQVALREVKMLARTLREDPSIVLHGVQHEGVKVP